MIDWVDVVFDAVWVAGLAIVLAAFGYHDWLARETRRRLRDVWPQASWQIPSSAGMLLTCVGFARALAERLWETAVWTALAIAFAGQLVAVVLERRRKDGS